MNTTTQSDIDLMFRVERLSHVLQLLCDMASTRTLHATEHATVAPRELRSSNEAHTTPTIATESEPSHADIAALMLALQPSLD